MLADSKHYFRQVKITKGWNMKLGFNEDKANLRARIWKLDFEPIIIKLMDKIEGKGWDLDTALSAVEEYRRFLFLTVGFPDTIVPTEFVDAVWHAHILDTIKYADDCNKTFGFFLHHFPYFGMRGVADQMTLQNTFAATASLYEKQFGSPYYVGIKGANCGNCGTNCGGQNCTTDPTWQSVVPDVVRSYERPRLAAYA